MALIGWEEGPHAGHMERAQIGLRKRAQAGLKEGVQAGCGLDGTPRYAVCLSGWSEQIY